jgi:predicted RNase H-like HicB family nuclease
MTHEYRVVYSPIENGWILAMAPALPGAATQGKDMAEARENIEEAIQLLLESYRENAAKNAPGNAIWETISIESSVS